MRAGRSPASSISKASRARSSSSPTTAATSTLRCSCSHCLPKRRRRTAVAAAADYFYTSWSLAGAVSLAFGTVPLARDGRGAGADLGALIDAGWNLVVFAEGTRSRDGRVGRMRLGGCRARRRAWPPNRARPHCRDPPGHAHRQQLDDQARGRRAVGPTRDRRELRRPDRGRGPLGGDGGRARLHGVVRGGDRLRTGAAPAPCATSRRLP